MTPTTTRPRPAPDAAPVSGRRAIDPRFSARRSEIVRRQGRRRLQIVGALTGAVILLFGVWSLLHGSLFSAKVVTVVGAVHETTAQIDAVAGLAHHPALLDFDAATAEIGLRRLPWVRTATVAVHWPDGVEITVVEEVPALVMRTSSGRWAELSVNGRVLAVVAARPPGLMEMTGPLAPGAPGSTLGAADALGLRVAATLPPSFRAQVTGVTIESGGWVQLSMTTPILVDLGNGTQLTDKYEDVSAYLAHGTLHDGDVIDVSVPGAPTVTGG